MKERRRDGEKRQRGDSHLLTTTPHLRASASPSFHAKKSLGQNFLADVRVIERIVQELRPQKDETVIEIGPGRGALTTRLVKNAGRLFAIEFDRELIPLLSKELGGFENFTLIEGDALNADLCKIIAPDERARVVGNLPYYISTAILRRLIEQRACLREMMLMLQREVVERITAPPSSSERGFLSVLVQAYCDAEALFDVPPTAFRPAPKVWSTVVRLRVRRRPAIEVADENLLWQIVSAGFAQRRKTIFNNLRSSPAQTRSLLERAGGAGSVLERAGIEARRRAETLTLDEWGSLTRVLEVLL